MNERKVAREFWIDIQDNEIFQSDDAHSDYLLRFKLPLRGAIHVREVLPDMSQKSENCDTPTERVASNDMSPSADVEEMAKVADEQSVAYANEIDAPFISAYATSHIRCAYRDGYHSGHASRDGRFDEMKMLNTALVNEKLNLEKEITRLNAEVDTYQRLQSEYESKIHGLRDALGKARDHMYSNIASVKDVQTPGNIIARCIHDDSFKAITAIDKALEGGK